MVKKHERAILVCQAPVEVPNILSFYDEVSLYYKEITIVSRDTESFNDFFKYIGIKANYACWKLTDDFRPFKPWTWRHFKRQVKKNLSGIPTENCDVYYSSRYDFFSYCHFIKFGENVSFYYRDKMDSVVWQYAGLHELNTIQSIKMKVEQWIKEMYCGAKLSYSNCGTLSILGFCPEKIGHYIYPILSEQEQNRVINKYTYCPAIGNTFPTVLFLTEPFRNKFHTQTDYVNMNKMVVVELQKRGYKVIMKGHPRLGVCEEIKNIVDDCIPQFVPSEFIDYKKFCLAIGFVSTALCGASVAIPSYSVLNMCQITDTELASYWRNFLNKHSDNKVKFLSSFEQL